MYPSNKPLTLSPSGKTYRSILALIADCATDYSHTPSDYSMQSHDPQSKHPPFCLAVMPATDNTARQNNDESLAKFTPMNFTEHMTGEQITLFVGKLTEKVIRYY